MIEDTEKTILLVDDSPILLRNLKSILDRKYTVFLTTSGREALGAIPVKEPDLVVLDYKMPDLDGKAVFEKMQQDDYMKNIPVIFLTSVADRKSIESILKLRPAGYILKPPDQEKVLETIQDILSRTEGDGEDVE